ncbi:MAG TPA: AarF/ABC1/UbiB kinase family protein [Nitrospirota bacterium]|nr:AarF/ABC1/UbiB kinase family protein [Nitrospirota bacterium]
MSLLDFWRRHYRDLPRVRQIIAVASRHGFGHLVEQIGLQRFISFGRRMLAFRQPPPPEHRLNTPERVRLMFEELGPSFIKLGQLLASRPDMIPLEYARELNKLTDSVAPFPFTEVQEIIEQDLGSSLATLFTEFDRTPVAAASIAQVHRAVLPGGAEVMVKVQRPNIEQMINRDISILRGLAVIVETHVPELAPYNPPGIVEEFARTISREMDFFIEASSAIQLRKNFEKSNILSIPKIYAERSSRRVLVMERVEGVRIDDYPGLDRRKHDRRALSRKGAEAFFQMVFQHGFFHADPHPGNIFVLGDGRLALVDFGIMGRVTEENREYFANSFLALVNHDYDALVQQYVNLGFVSEEVADLDRFQREMKEDLMDLLEPYYGMTVKQIEFGAYVERVTKIFQRHQLRLPQNLYLIDKALITLEGILRQLDPGFDFLEVAGPYVTDLIRRQRSPLHYARVLRKNAGELSDMISGIPRQMRNVVRKVLRNDIRVNIHHDEMSHLIRDLDKSSNRIAFSVITAAIIVASSLIIHAGTGPRVFDLPVFGLLGYVIAGLFGLWILIGILRSGQL